MKPSKTLKELMIADKVCGEEDTLTEFITKALNKWREDHDRRVLELGREWWEKGFPFLLEIQKPTVLSAENHTTADYTTACTPYRRREDIPEDIDGFVYDFSHFTKKDWKRYGVTSKEVKKDG